MRIRESSKLLAVRMTKEFSIDHYKSFQYEHEMLAIIKHYTLIMVLHGGYTSLTSGDRIIPGNPSMTRPCEKNTNTFRYIDRSDSHYSSQQI